MKQASRDTGPMRGCAHRGFVSRPALVQPPRMRVGLKPRSRHGGPDASMERKLRQREMAPIDGRHPRSGKQLLVTQHRHNRSWQLLPGRTHAKA